MGNAETKFTYRITAEGVDAVKAAFGELKSKLFEVAGIGGLGFMIENSLKTATNIEEMSRQAGMSTRAFQEWSYTLQKFGIDQGKASEEMTKFNVAAAQFVTQNAGPGKAAFERLGFSQEDVQKGLQNFDVFYGQVLARIGKLKNEAEKLELLRAIGGRGSADLIGPANAGLAAMTAYREEAERVGVVMNDDVIKGAHEAETRLNTLYDILHMKVAVAIDENADKIAHLAQVAIDNIPVAIKLMNGLATAAGWTENLGAALYMQGYNDVQAGKGLFNKLLPPGINGFQTDPLVNPFSAFDQNGGEDEHPLHVTIHNRSGSSGGGKVPIGDAAAAEQAKREAEAYAKLTDNLRSEIAAMGTSDREIFINTEERKLHTGATQDQKDAVAALAGELFDEKQRWEDLKSAATGTGDAISNALEDSIVKGKSFHDVLTSLESTLEDIAYKFFIGDELSRDVTSGLEGLFGKGGAADSVTGSSGGIFGGILSGLFGGGGAAVDTSVGQAVNVPDIGVLQSFAVGTDYVPYDMIAQIHKGERIVPASQNAAGLGGVSIVVNNNSSAQVTPQVSSGGDGKTQIVMMIDDAVSNLMQNPFSKIAAAQRTQARTPPVRY